MMIWPCHKETEVMIGLNCKLTDMMIWPGEEDTAMMSRPTWKETNHCHDVLTKLKINWHDNLTRLRGHWHETSVMLQSKWIDELTRLPWHCHDVLTKLQINWHVDLTSLRGKWHDVVTCLQDTAMIAWPGCKVLAMILTTDWLHDIIDKCLEESFGYEELIWGKFEEWIKHVFYYHREITFHQQYSTQWRWSFFLKSDQANCSKCQTLQTANHQWNHSVPTFCIGSGRANTSHILV